MAADSSAGLTVFTREVVLEADGSPTRGLQLRADGQTLGDVAEGSLADRARLLRDDRLLSIDSKDAKELDPSAVRLSIAKGGDRLWPTDGGEETLEGVSFVRPSTEA